MRRLIVAAEGARPVEGVITGFASAGLVASGRLRPRDPVGFALLAAEIETAAARDPQPPALHALGLLRVLERRPATAIAPLRSALEASPGSPELRSDLAAALLATGTRDANLKAAVEALDVVQAVSIEAGLRNANLARERLGLSLLPTSVTATRTDREWGEPGAGRIREILLEDLIPRWGSAPDQAERRALTSEALEIGTRLERETGDRTFRELAEVLVADDESLRRAAALRGEARRLDRADDFAASLERLTQAWSAASSTGEAWRLLLSFEIGRALFYLGRNDEASDRLAVLDTNEVRDRNPVLWSRANHVLAILGWKQGDLGRSVERLLQAIPVFETTRDPVWLQAALYAASEQLLHVGEMPGAWSLFDRAVRATDELQDTGARTRILYHGARMCLREGWQQAATAFAGELAELGQRAGDPVIRATGESLLAESAAGEGAAIAAAALEVTLSALPPSAMRDQLEVNARTAIGNGLAEREPERALALLRAAVAVAGAPLEARLRAAQALARLQVVCGNPDAAAGALEAALALATDRARMPAELRRVSLDDSVEAATRQLVRLQALAGRHEAALQELDAGRERRWRAIRGSSAPLADEPLASVLAAIPSGVVALVLEESEGDEVLLWLCRSHSVSFHRISRALFAGAPLGEPGLQPDARADAIPADLREAARAGGLLLVSAPPALRVGSAGLLARLASGADGPAAQVAFVRSLRAICDVDPRQLAEPGPAAGIRLLVVMPLVTGGSERELSLLRAAYPNAVVLAGERATPEAVRQQLATSTAVYFSGHSSRLGTNEALSYLELAGNSGPRRVFLSDLLSWPTAGIRWAALAACETGVSARDGRLDAAGLAQGLAALWKAPVFASFAPLRDADAAAFANEVLGDLAARSFERRSAQLFLR